MKISACPTGTADDTGRAAGRLRLPGAHKEDNYMLIELHDIIIEGFCKKRRRNALPVSRAKKT
jgi:hypothetical protein